MNSSNLLILFLRRQQASNSRSGTHPSSRKATILLVPQSTHHGILPWFVDLGFLLGTNQHPHKKSYTEYTRSLQKKNKKTLSFCVKIRRRCSCVLQTFNLEERNEIRGKRYGTRESKPSPESTTDTHNQANQAIESLQ